MYRAILMLMLVFATFRAPLLAQQTKAEEIVSIPRSQLTPQQAASVEQQNMEAKIAQYGKWVGLGKEVGEAVNGSLSALSTQADSFAKTGVGKFTMFLVAYKVVGSDALDVLISFPLMVVMTALFIWSYRKSCVTRSVLESETISETKVRQRTYKIINQPLTQQSMDGDKDLDGRRVTHAIIYLIVMAILFAVAVG